MDRSKLLVAALLLGLVPGCNSLYDDHGPRGRSEMWVTDAIRSASLNRALVVQAAVFPYHFTTRTAAPGGQGMSGQRLLVIMADPDQAAAPAMIPFAIPLGTVDP